MGKATGCSGATTEEINPSLVGAQPVASRIYNALTTSVAAVGTVFPHAIGAPFCADGALTGENCKGVVDGSNVCANINDNGTIVTVCNLTSGHSSDGSRLVQHGDSGGPVYLKVTGGVGRSGSSAPATSIPASRGTTYCSPTSKSCAGR
jgi:hypothetical protein